MFGFRLDSLTNSSYIKPTPLLHSDSKLARKLTPIIPPNHHIVSCLISPPPSQHNITNLALLQRLEQCPRRVPIRPLLLPRRHLRPRPVHPLGRLPPLL